MSVMKNKPMRQKITMVIMAITAFVMTLACGLLFVFEIWTVRERFKTELSMMGDMVAGNLAVATMFEDEEKSEEILGGFGAVPQIVAAQLVLTNGKNLAAYGQMQPADEAALQTALEGEPITAGFGLSLVKPVSHAGRRLGKLYLRADYTVQTLALLKSFGAILSAVLVGSLWLAYALSGSLQKLLTSRLLKLADTARNVAEEKDYSVRAEEGGTDEVGMLTRAFNLMLEQIQAQEAALESEHLKETLAQLLALETEVAVRKTAQAAQEKLLAINEATTDFVGSADIHGHTFYINPAGRRMIGLPDEIKVESLMIKDFHPPAIARLLLQEALPCAIKNGSWSGETTLLHQDGHEVHVSQVIIAHKNDQGEVVGFSTVVRDVSERKAAEAALQEAQQQLVETSRLSGMAEVATSVLHNVGNVLNSVNVSGNLISERLRGSKVSALSRVAKLLDENRTDFAAFVATDPRGVHIPELVSRINEAIRDENTELISEVDLITSHINHIKEIVAMQQSYAKAGGSIEQLKAAELVEDAIKMRTASLQRHHVGLIRDYADTPPVQVDRHKVVQILVNLLANSTQAIEELNGAERNIRISITKSGDQHVQISVADTGIGIAPENLTRIFAHGFTTKKTGHGFGLHSGAIAAQELGGALRVKSDGKGRGATFTLELPIAKPAVPQETAAPSLPS